MLRTDEDYASWGLYPPAQHVAVYRPAGRARISWDLRAAPHWLPRGQGRSYGDSCLNPGGGLIDTCGLDRFIAFDETSGMLRCEAGVTLAEIIRRFLPRGWFPTVTPGTQFVTVAGAVANDVHGKNHHREGCFGNTVTALSLVRSDGRTLECSPRENSQWFAATIGGIGLTGLITSVEFRLRRVAGGWVVQESRPFGSIAEFLDLSRRAESDHEYVVAWIDCFSGGGAHQAGVLFSGDHAASAAGDHPPPERAVGVPFTPPVSLLSAPAVWAFNRLYRWASSRQPGPRLAWYRPFFYPLDAVRDWNRIYGPRGFQQYQCVIPPQTEEAALPEMLTAIRRARLGSPLAVLKRFGDVRSPGLCSFPRPGTTLALDFPMREPDTPRLLARLDAIVEAAGGRLYPAKDGHVARPRGDSLFPDFSPLEPFLDPAMSSGFWRRIRSVPS